MIARSTTAKGGSLILAAALLAGAMQLAAVEIHPALEGGGAAVEAVMGSQFEDMSAGALSALTPKEALTPTTEPEAMEATKPPPPTEALRIAEPDTLSLPAGPDTVGAIPQVEPVAIPAQEAKPEATPKARTASQTLEASTPENDAPLSSKRPAQRNPVRAAQAAEKQQAPRRETRQKAARGKAAAQMAPRGNAQRNNLKGSDTGISQTAKATSSGQQAVAASQAGNAAASNYPGQVMRRISRLPKPRVNARGTTVVAFSIAAGGRLAGVSIARGSGSASLDQAAVTLIRSAAPFPSPPVGAQRQFSIGIKGR